MKMNPTEVRETVNHIAQALGETEQTAQLLIRRIVYQIGAEDTAGMTGAELNSDQTDLLQIA